MQGGGGRITRRDHAGDDIKGLTNGIDQSEEGLLKVGNVKGLV